MLSKVLNRPASAPVAPKGRIQKVRPRGEEGKNRQSGRNPEPEKKKRRIKEPLAEQNTPHPKNGGIYSENGTPAGRSPSSPEPSEEENRIDILV